MLSKLELIKIARWFEQNFVGEYYISFVKGFEGIYIIVEQSPDCNEGRQVFKVSEILSEV